MDSGKLIRIAKFLAERGVASRRRAEELIRAGRVAVNGAVVVEPGVRVEPEADSVTVDGQPVQPHRERRRTIMLYKPRGYICSASTRQGRTVYQLLPSMPERLVPVGRLDKDSEGLLLLSNDGELVLRMTHPRFEHTKTYRITVEGAVTKDTLAFLRSRMTIDGYVILPAEVQLLRESTHAGRQVLEMVLREGRKHQVRLMCEAAGLRVTRLVRTAVGELTLQGLRPGQWRELTQPEAASLELAL